MGQIRILSRQSKMTMLGQLGLSITATVAATLIVSGIQNEFASRTSAPAGPELTSGGKFAARIEALRVAAADTTPAIVPTPRVPLLVADASLRSLPLIMIEDPTAAPKTPEPIKTVRRAAHAEPHRRVADQGVDVLPPRRSDSVEAEAPAAVEQADSPGLWSTTKGLYKQALWLGGATLAHVNPVNLLP